MANQVILIGRMTKDIDIRQTTSGTTVGRFTLAVDRFGKDKGADFINCIAFEKKAEVLQMYTHKGSKIAVIGRIQTGSYTNKDGQKVYTTDVIVNEIEFCESRKEEPKEEKDISSLEEDLPFN
jgi:single-strand DNA-binding protein